MARESQIVNSILRWLNSQPGTLARKLHGSQYSVKGDPDIYGCIDGKMFLIECKRPGEQPRPIQVKRLQEWQERGAVLGVASSLQEAQQILRGLYE